MQKSMSSTHRLVLMALLIAMNVVLSRFLSLAAWNVKIGFGFVPIVMAAMMFGPVYGGIVAALADFIGATLFPVGQFFFGFTATAAIGAVIYGLLLHKQPSTKKIVFAVVAVELICSLGLNTFWISLMYGAPFWSLLPVRGVQSLAMGVVEIVMIKLLVSYLPVLTGRMQRA